jgi:hypothetical protein
MGCVLLFLALLFCGPIGWVVLALLLLGVFPNVPCF